MPSKFNTKALPPPPPLGTVIGDRFELVEILGAGGYAVVYRAVDRLSRRLKSYAVKCLIHSSKHRHLNVREVALHQLASVHPSVVTLHSIIDIKDHQYTFLVMDYSRDGDLFSQILNKRRYLGEQSLIKYIFGQLLDAVEYCHSLGIYHRDLKPENVLCFDGGLRVAITDFGLATTEKVSDDFHTGSMYHMSPECFSEDFLCAGSYSPPANDIWSLAIILLNLVTGRHPWTSASASDPTFEGYLKNPTVFLPTALPISLELNAVLTQMLDLNWGRRMTLPEVRRAINDVDNFYCPGAVFKGSMALCPWEATKEVKGSKDSREESAERRVHMTLKSQWSDDSMMERPLLCGATWGSDTSSVASSSQALFTALENPSAPYTACSPTPTSSGSMPTTPVGAVNEAAEVVSTKSPACGQYTFHSNIFTASSTHATVEGIDPYSVSLLPSDSLALPKAQFSSVKPLKHVSPSVSFATANDSVSEPKFENIARDVVIISRQGRLIEHTVHCESYPMPDSFTVVSDATPTTPVYTPPQSSAKPQRLRLVIPTSTKDNNRQDGTPSHKKPPWFLPRKLFGGATAS